MAESKDGKSNLSNIKNKDWHNSIKWVELCKKCGKDVKKCDCKK
jgi:hypothetical protein